MDSATEELLLQKIEEFVFDEDKIITTSILCEKCNISLAEGKHVLEKFISDQQVSSGKISATYLISGILKTECYGIQIVDAVSLEDKKKAFKKVNDEVVYSVQKNNVIDLNAIALAEKSDNARAKAFGGSIVSENCIERNIKTKVLPPIPPQKNYEKSKPSSFFKPQPKTEQKLEDEKKTAISSPTSNSKPNKKTGGLTSFLSQSSLNSIKASNGTKVKEEISDENIQLSKEKPETVIKEEKVEELKSEEQEITEDHSSNSQTTEVICKKVATSTKRKRKENKKTKDQDGKKRKRIIMESDSDDDLFGNDEEEKMDVVESDEEKSEVVPQKEPSAPIPKNKRRKAIEKTYEDEDGYIVTRTEYVLVSASEDEEIIEAKAKEQVKIEPNTGQKGEKKKSPEKSSKKKGKSVATNQPTLMNFFKKK